MIQRIQSLYLFGLIVIHLLAYFGVSHWINFEGNLTPQHEQFFLIFLESIMVVLAIISLFSFKNRKKQFILNRLNMILHLLAGVMFLIPYLSFTQYTSEGLVPVLSALLGLILLALANKAIKKDEDLVRSADRIR